VAVKATAFTTMNKDQLEEGDEVALLDSSCSNNVYKGIITCLTKGKNGVWVAVNYRYGLLPTKCAGNPDRWILIKTNGKSIAGMWSKYQVIADKQAADKQERQASLESLRDRVKKVSSLLNQRGIESRVMLGSFTISVEEMEKLLGAADA